VAYFLGHPVVSGSSVKTAYFSHMKDDACIHSLPEFRSLFTAIYLQCITVHVPVSGANVHVSFRCRCL